MGLREKFAISSKNSKKTPKEQFYWILTEVETMVEVTIPIFWGGSGGATSSLRKCDRVFPGFISEVLVV